MRVSSFRCLLLITVLAFLSWNCGGSTQPPPLAVGSFELELPDSVDAAESFSVMITAIGNDGSRPYVDYSGPVGLSASEGHISPSTVDLVEGVGEAEVMATAIGGEITVTASIGDARGSKTLVINPLSRLPGDDNDDAGRAIPRLDYTVDGVLFDTTHPDAPGVEVSYNTVILVFEPGTTVGEANDLLDEVNAIQITGGLPGEGGEATGYMMIRVPAINHAELTPILTTLNNNANIRAAVQDVGVGPHVVPPADNNPLWNFNLPINSASLAWGMQLSRFPQAWSLAEKAKKRGHEVYVGVLDVGFCTPPANELDILANLEPTIQRDGDHGIHVAGTVAAQWNGTGVDGAIPECKLVVSAVTTQGMMVGDMTNLIETYPQLRAINVSVGYTWAEQGINANTSTFAQTVANASGLICNSMLNTLASGRVMPLILASNGNDSNHFGNTLILTEYNSPFTNAATVQGNPYIFGVEALANAPSAPGGAQRASFSNVGGHISAPGVNIVSTECGSYNLKSGTSMAAPHVTGLAGYLCYLAPGLSLSGLKSVLTAGTVPVSGGGSHPTQNRIDAWNSVMELNTLLGGSQLILDLCDIDDGTADGNRRVELDNPSVNFTEDDADGDNGWGDGVVDMSDFRMFRDHLLYVEDPSTLDLDGSDTHPKLDLNRDKLVKSGAEENLYPRTDFNGDGIVSRDSTIAVAGIFQGEQKTDLDILKHLFTDDHYEKSDLDTLLDSGDITVDATNCLSIANIARVHSWVTDSNDMMVGERDHVDEDTKIQVYTVLADDLYTVHMQAFDSSGAIVDQKQEEYTVTHASDDYWEPKCEKIILEASLPLTMEVDTPTPVLIRAGWEDDDGNRRFEEGIDINIIVAGGTVNQNFGTTNSEGFLAGTEATLTAGNDILTLIITATAPSGAEETLIKMATRHVDCEVAGAFTTRGDGIIEPGFGEVQFTGEATGRAEYVERFKVIPADSTLFSQDGRIIFKIRLFVETSGYSGVNPSVRTAFWPTDKVWGQRFRTYQWTTPGNGDPINVDEEVEVNLAMRFNSEFPIEMRTQAFANEEQSGFRVTSSFEVLEIVRITDNSGNEITPLAICTASGHEY